MATKGGRIDFMFLGPPTRPLDPMLYIIYLLKTSFLQIFFCGKASDVPVFRPNMIHVIDFVPCIHTCLLISMSLQLESLSFTQLFRR